MMVDTIRAFAAYGIAAVVTLAGLVIIYLTRDELAASDLRVLIAGFIGSSLTFVYGSEVQTRTARQAASQTLAANTGPNGGSGHASLSDDGTTQRVDKVKVEN